MENNQEEWVVVDETFGPGLAEIIRGFLLSCGIEAQIIQQGAWEAFPTTVGELGKTSILVRREDKEQALVFLKDFYEREIPPDSEEQTGEDYSTSDG